MDQSTFLELFIHNLVVQYMKGFTICEYTFQPYQPSSYFNINIFDPLIFLELQKLTLHEICIFLFLVLLIFNPPELQHSPVNIIQATDGSILVILLLNHIT